MISIASGEAPNGAANIGWSTIGMVSIGGFSRPFASPGTPNSSANVRWSTIGMVSYSGTIVGFGFSGPLSVSVMVTSGKSPNGASNVRGTTIRMSSIGRFGWSFSSAPKASATMSVTIASRPLPLATPGLGIGNCNQDKCGNNHWEIVHFCLCPLRWTELQWCPGPRSPYL